MTPLTFDARDGLCDPRALMPSPTNRIITDASVADLVESIKQEGGIFTPLVVRPLPDKYRSHAQPGQEFEIVCGGRRHRAALLLGLEYVPIREARLDDKQTAALQAAENINRENFSPLEEAQALQHMVDAGMTKAEVAERIGKSTSHVYGKLNLLKLVPAAREALAAGILDESAAVPLSRLPACLQPEAVARITAFDPEREGERISTRRAIVMLQQDFTRNLKKAPWPRDMHFDAAGLRACDGCDSAHGDTCCNPICYDTKRAEYSAILLGISDDTPRVDIPKVSGTGPYNWTDYDAAGYRDSAATCPFSHGQTYAEWLKAHGETAPRVIHHDTIAGEARALISKADLTAAKARIDAKATTPQAKPEQPAQPAPKAEEVGQGKYDHIGEDDDYTRTQRAKEIILSTGRPNVLAVQHALRIGYGDTLKLFEILTKQGFLDKTTHGNSWAYTLAEQPQQPEPPAPFIGIDPAAPGGDTTAHIDITPEQHKNRPTSTFLQTLRNTCRRSPPMLIAWPLTRLIARFMAAHVQHGHIPESATEQDCIAAIVCYLTDAAAQAGEPELLNLAHALNINTDEIREACTQPDPTPHHAKFRHPEDPTLHWSGHGRKPQLVLDWISAGGDISDLKIEATEAGG